MRMWQVRAVIGPLLADPTTALHRAVTGYGVSTGQLLIYIYDVLAGANWQRTHGKAARPKPLERILADDAQRRELERLHEANMLGAGELAEALEYLSQFDPEVAAARAARAEQLAAEAEEDAGR